MFPDTYYRVLKYLSGQDIVHRNDLALFHGLFSNSTSGKETIQEMLNLHLLEMVNNSYNNIRISDYGVKVLSKQIEKERKEEIKERLAQEKLEIDYKNAKRVFKTYWWTFGFAVVGLLISLFLLFLKIAGK